MKITKRDLLIGAGAGLAGVSASQLRQRLAHHSPPPYDHRVISYAQSGEDLIVSFLFSW